MKPLFAERIISVSKGSRFPFKTGRRAQTSLISAVFSSVVRATGLALKHSRSAPAKARKPRTKGGAVKPPVTAVVRPRKMVAPARASFSTAVHDCDFGQRHYKIYVPASAANSADPLPVLVMLHGCGQTPDDFARGTRMNTLAEEFRLLVVYPAQSREAHPKRCWNWFRPGDQGRNAGEPALLASLTREVLRQHPADPARVYVAGLSAGGSAAAILAQAYPDLFAAVGVHSGLPAGAARSKTLAIVAMGQGNPGTRSAVAMPTIVFHGSEDRIVHPRNARFITIRAVEPHASLRETQLRRQVPGGRSYIKSTHRKGQGRPLVEHWLIEGSGHAWSGGSSAGRFVDPSGPDASREMVRFFLLHKRSISKPAADVAVTQPPTLLF